MRKFTKLMGWAVLSVFVMALTSIANASQGESNTQGIYAGAQLGKVNLNNSHANNDEPLAIIFPISFLSQKLGGRAYAGYRIDDNYAVEVGYDGLADSSDSGGVLNEKNHTKVKGLDVMAKFIYPTKIGLSLFGKAGGAYIHQDILESTNGGSTVIYSSDTQKIVPVIGLGASFNLTSSLAIDATWHHFIGWGEIENIDFTAIGINYAF